VVVEIVEVDVEERGVEVLSVSRMVLDVVVGVKRRDVRVVIALGVRCESGEGRGEIRARPSANRRRGETEDVVVRAGRTR